MTVMSLVRRNQGQDTRGWTTVSFGPIGGLAFSYRHESIQGDFDILLFAPGQYLDFFSWNQISVCIKVSWVSMTIIGTGGSSVTTTTTTTQKSRKAISRCPRSTRDTPVGGGKMASNGSSNSSSTTDSSMIIIFEFRRIDSTAPNITQTGLSILINFANCHSINVIT
jgi:hypothetical protein